ncbi:MAG: FAD-binding dehydrogenase, partial [Muribaculaceae bacterium]|nr:FAD-binding dehydrogenase [Muribaculaceae bacterium]
VFKASFDESEYIFVCFMANDSVQLRQTDSLLTGTTTVLNQINLAVSNYGRQDPPEGIGIESFEFWCPLRRPEGKNIAFTLTPAQEIYSTELLDNCLSRPVGATNAWAASLDDKSPELTLEWPEAQTISSITLFFDTDYDQAMETVQMGHYDSVMPYCVTRYTITDENGDIVADRAENHQAMNVIRLDKPLTTSRLKIRLDHPGELIPASLFHIVIK